MMYHNHIPTDLPSCYYRDATASKPLFNSHLIEGVLLRDPKTTNKFKVQWGTQHTLQSAHNEAGRGMELSELVSYKGCGFLFSHFPFPSLLSILFFSQILLTVSSQVLTTPPSLLHPSLPPSLPPSS